MSFRVRPARVDDFDVIYEMAKLTGGGFTNLPPDRGTLTEKLIKSEKAFGREADEPGDDLEAVWAVPGVAPAGERAGGRPSGAVEAVRAAVEALAGVPVAAAPADVAVLLVLAERLRALAVCGLAELDASGACVAAGASSAAVSRTGTSTSA